MILSERRMRMDVSMRSTLSHFALRTAGCCTFSLLWLPYLWLSAVILTFGLGWAQNPGERSNIFKFVIFGNGYFLASILCFLKMKKPVSLLLCGVLLNTLAGYLWMPWINGGTHGGWMMAAPGLVLLALWVRLVWVTLRDVDVL